MSIENGTGTESLSESSVALRRLIMQNVVEVQAQNDRHEAFVRQMQADALGFASVMNSVPNVRTDVAVKRVVVEPRSFWREAAITEEKYPFWEIREGKRYGGSSLHPKNMPKYEGKSCKRIAVLTTGSLAIVGQYRRPEDYLPSYNPNDQFEAAEFVDRTVFDSEEATERAYALWLSDLEKAARRYSRKP